MPKAQPGPSGAEQAQAAAAAAERRRRAALSRRGHEGTILTGPSGAAPAGAKVIGG